MVSKPTNYELDVCKSHNGLALQAYSYGIRYIPGTGKEGAGPVGIDDEASLREDALWKVPAFYTLEPIMSVRASTQLWLLKI